MIHNEPQMAISRSLLDIGVMDARTIEHSPSVELELVDSSGGKAIRVSQNGSDPLPYILFRAPDKWDLTSFLYLSFDVANRGNQEALVTCRLNGDQWVAGGDLIPAGGSRTVKVIVPQNGAIPDHLRKALYGLNGLPGYALTTISRRFDVRHVETLQIQFPNPARDLALEISNLLVEAGVHFFSEDELAGGFFPFVDAFGQYQHKEWATKVHSVQELRTSVDVEETDLQAHPGPGDWNEYGGWAAGPQLEATGHFYTTKVRDRWWLVDPSGCLFWSHGVCAVGPGGATPITDREHYFATLPPRDEHPDLYQDLDLAPFGYYAGKSMTMFNIAAYNLMRKYGPSWRKAFVECTHRRLRSWGMNSMGGWTADEMYMAHRTPYALTLRSRGRSIEGSEGHWRKFPDPFDLEWREHLAERLAQEEQKSAHDPYCIGYFVDNELSWNHDTYLARGALLSPPDQPAKLAFREHLQAKYGSLEALNGAWGTDLRDWDAFLAMGEVPEGIDEDLRAFTVAIAEQYLSVCRAEIRRAAPNKLYLGARWDFHLYPHEDDTHGWVLRIAARYCDILSFNRYRYTCLELVPPQGIDSPILISEWHIGTLERGMFHTGLRGAVTPEHEQRMYQAFVRQALQNPYIVGTHWFQYGEQAVSGRFDGENYRIGLVDITDRPYAALIDASRQVGYSLYASRFQL